LFSEADFDEDLRLVIERWDELADHVKAAIRTLAQGSR
jgi:hypothetical protein